MSMSHFLQSILLLGLLVGRKFRVEPGSCAGRSGAWRRGASKQGLLQSLGHGQGTEKSAAAVSHGAMPPPQPRNRPGHARLSGRRHCMPPVVQAGRAAEPPQ